MTIITDGPEISISTPFDLYAPGVGSERFTPTSAVVAAAHLLTLLLHRPISSHPDANFWYEPTLVVGFDGDVRIEVPPNPNQDAWRVTWPDLLPSIGFPSYSQTICHAGGKVFSGGLKLTLDFAFEGAQAQIEHSLMECARSLGEEVLLPSTFAQVAWLAMTLYRDPDALIALLEEARDRTLRFWPLYNLGAAKRSGAPKLPYFLEELESLVRKQHPRQHH